MVSKYVIKTLFPNLYQKCLLRHMCCSLHYTFYLNTLGLGCVKIILKTVYFGTHDEKLYNVIKNESMFRKQVSVLPICLNSRQRFWCIKYCKPI